MKNSFIKDNFEKNKLILKRVRKEISNYIIGQTYMIDRILMGIFTGGNILIEGLPGLGKTSTINMISQLIGLSFKRIQFTPDLLPSDIIGSIIYYKKIGEFITKKGPIFSNIVLADEINRAPAKAQSALLEAMQERQVTIGGKSFKLNPPFIVLATQNPLDRDDTYPLPEAQQDRFMMKIKISYPNKEEELAILNKFSDSLKYRYGFPILISRLDVFSIRESIKNVHLSNELKEYIIDLIFKTRESSNYIKCGSSPRGTISLLTASKALAFFKERDYVIAEDIKEIAVDVLRHRIILSEKAKREEFNTTKIIRNILEKVKTP